MEKDGKVMVVPDVHGRTFWKDALTFDGPVVFLGDYLDPYPFEFDPEGELEEWFDGNKVRLRMKGPGYKNEAVENFGEILEFARANRERVRLLYGNHDVHYIMRGFDSSRRDSMRAAEIAGMFDAYADLFSRCALIGNLLLSHAGMSVEWLGKMGILCGSRSDIEHLPQTVEALPWKSLMMTSPQRGGWDEMSGPMWLDYHEIECRRATMPEEVAQVFGHTMIASEGAIVRGATWACVDSRSCFTVDPRLRPRHVIDSLSRY